MADHEAVEVLLNELLTPDNNVIQKATERLQQLAGDPNFIGALCTTLTISSSPQVRQYAAVLLRRKITKRKHWNLLSVGVQNSLKENIFSVLTKETEPSVRNSLSQLIGTIAHHCDELSEWPQLLQFLETFVKSENPMERQVSMMVLKTVSAEASEQLQPHLQTVLGICAHSLYDQNILIPYYSILVLNNMVFEVSSDEMKAFSDLIPRILEVIKQLAVHDEEQACEAMEIFDSLVECEVAILHPHVRVIVDYCLALAISEENPNAVRVKALECISWLVSLKKRAIQKMNLIQPILEVVFSLMCRCEDGDDDLEDSEETEKAASYAARIMDSLALHLPAEKIVTNVVKHSSQALMSERPSERKAGYVALGIIAEGCSDHISSKYLEQFLERVVKGFDDPHAGVRNGAMFALGQFSEHLQPGIMKYASSIIPLLLNYAVKVLASPSPSLATLTRTYYALEAYVENLEKDVFPYLPELMTHLLHLLDNSDTSELGTKLKEFSLSCIASIACAAKTNLNPYFTQIMDHFKKYLSEFDGATMKEIQLQALDTLSMMAREMDEVAFTPDIANMCVSLGLSLIEHFNDPDVRRCVYNLFSSLATLSTTDMVPRLPTIVNLMLNSLRSQEGVKVHYTVEECPTLANFDFDVPNGTENGVEEDDEDLAGISIENAFLDEKEDACTALSDLAIQYYEHFMPFMEACYAEALKLNDYGSSDIIKSSVKALCNFAVAVHDYNKKFNDEASANALKTMLAELVPKFLDMVSSETDRMLAMTALHCLQEMLDSIGEPVLKVSEDCFQLIITSIKNVLRGKTACQDKEDEEEGDDEEQAEFDTLLLEYAVGVLPLLAQIVGPQTFSPYMQEFMPHLLKKCKGSCTTTERAYSIGTIAECLDVLGEGYSTPYLGQLTPICLRGMHDADEELRNNSVFAMGVLVSNSAGGLAFKYTELLQTLHDMVKVEKSAQIRDNIASATARILAAGHQQLPVVEVYSLLLDLLPLTEDLNEYESIVKCLIDPMYTSYKALVLERLPQLLLVVSEALKSNKLSTGVSDQLAMVIKNLHDTEPEMLQRAMTTVPHDAGVWKLFPAGQ